MHRVLFVKFLLILFLINSLDAYSQQSKTDSLAIKYMGAVKLCSNLNPYIPDSIKFVMIEYLVRNQLNPKEFYTTKYSLQKNTKEGYVSLLKIGAIRDLYEMQFTEKKRVRSDNGDDIVAVEMRVGAAGGNGDDIVVVFDDKFRTIKRIVPSE